MDYFRVTEPLPGVYRLCGEEINFCTLVCGSSAALLFDTGMGIGDIRRAAEELTALPLTVVCSHEHFDHIGGNSAFDEVWMSQTSIRALSQAPLREIRRRALAAQKTLPAGLEPEEYLGRDCGTLRALAPEQVFDLGGRTLRVVPLPSHTAGSVGLFCPELGLLLSADSIAPMLSLIWPDSAAPEACLQLLERVEAMGCAQILCSHSAEPITHAQLRCCKAAFRTLRGLLSYPYKEPFYPDMHGRLCFYNGEEGAAAIICREDML